MTTPARRANVYRRLLRQARPYWLHITGLFLLSLLSAPLALFGPLPLKIAVDSAIGSHPLPGFLDALIPTSLTATPTAVLGVAVGLLVVVSLLRHLQSLATTVLSAYASEKLVLDFRTTLFRHVQRLSLRYHDSRGSADSVYRIQSDAPAIRHVAIDGVIPFVVAGVTFGAMLFVTIRIDWPLALVALAIAPILIWTSRSYRGRLRSRWLEVKRLQGAAISVVHEVLGAVRVVKAFGQEAREEERFVRRSNEGVLASIRVAMLEGSLGLFMGLTTTAGTATVLLIGVLHVQSGALTLGELLLVMGYLSQLYEPLRTIGRQMAILQSHLASAERAFGLLDEDPDVAERPDARPISRALGAVTFRDVSFTYGDKRPVLEGISFDLSPGSRLGIAGATGAGKTTLVSLLSRFYDPTEGQILLDGIDLREYRLADLRNQFSIVLQEPVLFSTSIAENIAYARPGASEADIVAAARAANAHEFVTRLPHGYATIVGERGMRLSGGERQRISLARAFLRNAPILILDEPTSSVDVKTEAVIMEAMARLMHGRTTLMIAHRLGTLSHCDRWIELNGGRVLTGHSGAVGSETLEAGLSAVDARPDHG